MPKPFILNDETVVNSHGFMVLNTGGQFERFKSNPVMLFGHEDDKLIGRWDNLRTEGKQLLADPVFDDGDEDSKKVQGKVERGFLKGASMGIHIIEAELQSIPGKDLVPVITKWELFEASLVGVPSNSLCLYTAKGELISSPEEIKLSIEQLINKNQKTESMDKIILTAEAAAVLNVSKEPDPTALSAAVMELSAKKEAAETKLNEFLQNQATALVDGAISEGRLTADKKDSFVKLAITDFKQAKDLIDAMPAKEIMSNKITPAGKGEKNREDWDYLRWSKEDPRGLAKMQKEDPDAFAQLKASYKKKF